MITAEHVLVAFRMFESAGLRKPEVMTVRAAHPQHAEAEARRAGAATLEAAELWAALLADLTPEEFKAAVLARLRLPSPFWPTTGEVLELVPRRQLAAVDDSDEAWTAVKTWCRRIGFGDGRREPRPAELDPNDVARDEALRAGLDALGGCKGYATADTAQEHHTARRFREAYQLARKRRTVAADGRLLTAMGASDVAALLGGGSPNDRGGGFRQLSSGAPGAPTRRTT